MASNVSTPQKQPDQRSKSCDTACSSNSSCFFQRRKPINPLANPLRSSHSRSTANSVRQRVLSAKLLKLKSVQNQLNDANYHLAEVIRENQALKTLQKRQDKALSKYEGENAELPRLIRSHEEEIRFLSEKNKILRKTVRDLNDQLKQKNDELQSIQEQLKHYEKLDKDKRLLEREKLVEELEDVRSKLKKADSEIVVLNRKLTLESKISKQRLNVEMAKHKESQRELAQSLTEISRLTKLLEAKDKSLTSNGRKRFSNLAHRQTSSLICLNGKFSDSPETEDSLIYTEKAPVTQVKLQRLIHSKDEENRSIKSSYKGILKDPSENIRARLSADSIKDTNEDLPSVDKLSLSGSESSTEKELQQSRPSSHKKLEKLEMNIHNTIRKIEDNKNMDDINKCLGNYCLEAVDNVKNCSDMIENHKENLCHAQKDTEKIIDTVKDVETIEKRLKQDMKLLYFDSGDGDNFDFVNQILKEEAEFQKMHKSSGKNGKKEPAVAQSDKKKLLATLRAIDNGDSVDSFDAEENGQSKKELFGNSSN